MSASHYTCSFHVRESMCAIAIHIFKSDALILSTAIPGTDAETMEIAKLLASKIIRDAQSEENASKGENL